MHAGATQLGLMVTVRGLGRKRAGSRPARSVQQDPASKEK